MTGPAAVAVLFDMDGLLIDSEPLWLEAEKKVMARLGGSWDARDQAALVGGSLALTVRTLLAKATRPEPPELVGKWVMAHITERVRRDGVPVRPGARELLAEVAAAGLPRALVTSSQRGFMQAVLASTGMTFDALVSGQDVTATKPDPEPYLLAARLLAVPPGDCFALEDSPNGVASAQAAGCRVIGVPSLLPLPPAPGRIVVPSLLDLTAGPAGIAVRTAVPRADTGDSPRDPAPNTA
jgi:HAD superfamily hydrolase (TIGR01509 family)